MWSGACVRAAALSMVTAHSLFALRRTDAAHMLPTLELDPATQTKAIFPPKWPPPFAPFILFSFVLVILTNGPQRPCVCPPTTMKERPLQP